jgi:MFS family permease
MSPAALAPERSGGVALGLAENRAQFALLVLVNAFVGMMVGVERSVLPLLAEQSYGIESTTAALSFIVAFGLSKAVSNFLAGDLAHRVGRRRILLAGWWLGLPVPALLWTAPSWRWVVVANLLLGVNQGLAWSATVIMKIDLAGPKQRGLAMGLNEFAGYVAVALAALGAGYLAGAHGPRAGIVWISSAAVVLGLLITLLFVRDTAAHVELEHRSVTTGPVDVSAALPTGVVARLREVSWTRTPLLGAHQAGLVNNLNDGVAWGLFPLYFAAAGLGLREIGWLTALYPAVWGIAQVGTGALSDRVERRLMIVGGMLLQATALGILAAGSGFHVWAGAAVLLGLGTAAVYPALIAQVSDLLPARDRAVGIGAYRLWRDLGYVAGGIIAGVAADAWGFRAAIALVAVITAASGIAALRLLPGARDG